MNRQQKSRPALRSRGERATSPRLIARVARVARQLAARVGNEGSPRQPGSRTLLIGLDVSRTPLRLKTRSVAPIAAAALVGALLLAVLRVDVIRVRFGLADSLAKELLLEAEKRDLTVEMRVLRDPAALSRRARALGFRRAERLIDLPRAGAPLPLLPRERRFAPGPIELVAEPMSRHEASARAQPARRKVEDRAPRQHAALAAAAHRSSP